MLRDVEREARLADRWTGGDDDEIAFLEARRQLVEVEEARGDAAQLTAMGVQVVEPVVGRVEQLLELGEADRDAPVRDLEELRLRPVDRLLDLGRVLVADAGDLAGGADEVPEHGFALDDPGVLDRVDGRRGRIRQLRQVGPPADLLEVLAALQGFGNRDQIHRLPALEQLEHRLVDVAVRLAVEVHRLQEFRDLDDRLAVDEDRPEDRLLGLEAVWRETVDHRAPRWRLVVTTDCHSRATRAVVPCPRLRGHGSPGPWIG